MVAMTTFNLQLIRGQPFNDPLLDRMGPWTFVWTEAVSRIINGPFAPAVEDNRRRVNVFYLSDPTNQDTRDFQDADSTVTAPGFQAGVAFGGDFTYDAFDLGTFRHESGHAVWNLADEYGCSTASNLQTSRFEPAVHGNILNELDHRDARSEIPSACRLISGAPDSCHLRDCVPRPTQMLM